MATADCPPPELLAGDAEDAAVTDAPSSSRTASPMLSTSCRTSLFCTPTPSKLSSAQKHIQGMLTDELRTCKQQLEVCRQQLESANTKAAVAEAAAAAAEAAAANHKARADRLHAQNLQLAAEAMSAQRMRANNRRAMDEIRNVIDWVQRPSTAG